MNEDSEKVAEFKRRIAEVCNEFGLCFMTDGYDSVQVWEIDRDDDMEILMSAEDRTNAN